MHIFSQGNTTVATQLPVVNGAEKSWICVTPAGTKLFEPTLIWAEGNELFLNHPKGMHYLSSATTHTVRLGAPGKSQHPPLWPILHLELEHSYRRQLLSLVLKMSKPWETLFYSKNNIIFFVESLNFLRHLQKPRSQFYSPPQFLWRHCYIFLINTIIIYRNNIWICT